MECCKKLYLKLQHEALCVVFSRRPLRCRRYQFIRVPGISFSGSERKHTAFSISVFCLSE